MRIRILSVAQKLPAWVDAGCAEYLARLPREVRPEIVTLPLAPRGAGKSAADRKQRQGRAILDQLSPGGLPLALDERGRAWSSDDWARELGGWMQRHPRVDLVIGGPDGLSAECLAACGQSVSLGPVTLPHALVRIVLLEQLYRAWCILNRHPYHRE